MDPAGIHDIDCVLATQEIADLMQKPAPAEACHVLWDEKRWEAMESGCLTAFDDVLMSSGGVLQSLLKFELLSRPAARLEFVFFVGNSRKNANGAEQRFCGEFGCRWGRNSVPRSVYIRVPEHPEPHDEDQSRSGEGDSLEGKVSLRRCGGNGLSERLSERRGADPA